MRLLGFLHERRRTQVTLLASGCLEGAERARAERHLETCAECRREHAEILQLVAAVASDPLRSAEPPVPVEFLVTRVEARLGRVVRSPAWRWAWLAAGIGIGLLAAPFASRLAERTRGTPPVGAEAQATVSMDDEALRRLARVLAREQAVRYLLEAGSAAQRQGRRPPVPRGPQPRRARGRGRAQPRALGATGAAPGPGGGRPAAGPGRSAGGAEV